MSFLEWWIGEYSEALVLYRYKCILLERIAWYHMVSRLLGPSVRGPTDAIPSLPGLAKPCPLPLVFPDRHFLDRHFLGPARGRIRIKVKAMVMLRVWVRLGLGLVLVRVGVRSHSVYVMIALCLRAS